MKVSGNTAKKIFFGSWILLNQPQASNKDTNPSMQSSFQSNGGILQFLKRRIDKIQVCDRLLAHRLCKLIPAQCPFERDLKLFGKTLFHIPPMCKLNPLYDELVGLRFRALCYLADECGEDVTQYC